MSNHATGIMLRRVVHSQGVATRRSRGEGQRGCVVRQTGLSAGTRARGLWPQGCYPVSRALAGAEALRGRARTAPAMGAPGEVDLSDWAHLADFGTLTGAAAARRPWHAGRGREACSPCGAACLVGWRQDRPEGLYSSPVR